MKSSWTVGLRDDQKAEMESSFRAAGALRERMKIMLEKKLEVARTIIIDKQKYENASWAFFQADHIGYERCISEIISLLE